MLYAAMDFACLVHGDQSRRYTGAPYREHLAEVAGIAMAALCGGPVAINVVGAVGWLHDTREDCGVTHELLAARFGCMVAGGVSMLSNLESGNRATRVAAAAQRLAGADGWVQTIKVADILSNTPSIVTHDPRFARTYLLEVSALLDVLTNADPRLWTMCRAELDRLAIELAADSAAFDGQWKMPAKGVSP